MNDAPKQQPPRILLVEDDIDAAFLVREVLTDHFRKPCVTHVDRVGPATAMDPDAYDLVLSDLNLPDGTGLELIEKLLARRPDLPIVLVTSESALDVATQAIRMGAYDYIVKAGQYLDTIPLIVEKNLAVWRIKQDKTRLEDELKRTLDELRFKNDQLQEAVSQLEQQASTDPLTGLANRRHMNHALERAFAESQRYRTDLTCVMIDLDGFKPLNDSLGHQMGDRVLQTTGRVLVANCRRSDVAGRFGGDEFILVLNRTDQAFAAQVAERIQEQFITATRAFLPTEVGVNMSIGIASVTMSKPSSADQLVAHADAALYRAKQAGKARIMSHGEGAAAVDASNHVAG